MMKFVMIVLMITLCWTVTSIPMVFADEAKYELKSPAATIKDILSEQTGKRVIVRLENGENLEGTVTRVGDSVVHIVRVSGKDFYDAVVRIDRISAVLFKVRGTEAK
jgi:hypothetical protein